MKIAVTYTSCVQVGVESYRDNHVTKIFSFDDSFANILQWAKSIGVRDPKLGDFIISEVLE
jgi:hypothetical protein